MGILSKISCWLRVREIRRQAREEAYLKLCCSPSHLKQVRKELDCLIYGHKWTSDFQPKGKIDKPQKDRTYCSRCGVYYHEHKYKKLK